MLRFRDGSKDMYAIWAVEKVTINPKTNRPLYTERTGVLKLSLKGKLFRFVDDGSGQMHVENFSTGQVSYSAKPVFIVAD